MFCIWPIFWKTDSDLLHGRTVPCNMHIRGMAPGGTRKTDPYILPTPPTNFTEDQQIQNLASIFYLTHLCGTLISKKSNTWEILKHGLAQLMIAWCTESDSLPIDPKFIQGVEKVWNFASIFGPSCLWGALLLKWSEVSETKNIRWHYLC